MAIKMDRRDFVRFVTGGTVGAATAGLSLHGLSRFNAAISDEARVPGGPENWCVSVCAQCDAGCGLRVRTIGKRVVKVQGNPLHPATRGGLCPKGLAALQELYHPDRLRSPLINAGTRRQPRWRSVSWDEANELLVKRLRSLRDDGQAHTVALLDGRARHMSGRLMREFMGAFGSPNYFAMPSGTEALEAAVYLQQGITSQPAVDWANTRYLLSFGVNLLEGWGSPVAQMRAFGHWREATGRRTKFVQIEPRFSLTAARADEFVALRPGTEAALALGIAHVLIAEDLYDAEFVRERTFGFEDWRDDAGRSHTGFRTLVMSEYRLDEVSATTGVPAETILRLAREFAANRPAVAMGDRQTSALAGDPYAAMAVHSLNAMVGSLDAPGGILFADGVPISEAQATREGPKTRVNQTEQLIFSGSLAYLMENLAAHRPYPINALLLHRADPIFSLPNGEGWRRALAEISFIASFTTLLNDSAAVADLLLPAPTGLEEWQGVAAPPALPQAVFAVSAPVIEPRHGARNPADVVLGVARALRGGVAQALPDQSFEQYLKRKSADIYQAQSGSVFSAGLEDTWNRMLDRSGWWAPTWKTADELWDQMKEKGGWWDLSYPYSQWERVFKTPSKRFEFYSQRLAARLRDDRQCLPHQRPVEKGEGLLLLPMEVLPLAGGQGAHLPYLQQIAGPHLNESWESWLEIHPETARKLGIADGDMVWVESKRGKFQVRARHYAGAHPEAVHLPLGYGHKAGSQWACRGVNPLDLVEARREPLAGIPDVWSTRVKVYRS